MSTPDTQLPPHPSEVALKPLPLAEAIDPQILIDYGDYLRQQNSGRPPRRYALYTNTLDLAIATRSHDLASQAYAGLTELTSPDSYGFHPNGRVTLYANLSLAYEPVMRQRIDRLSPERTAKARVYQALGGVLRLASEQAPHISVGNDMGNMAELLVAGASLRVKKGPQLYLGTQREEGNKCYQSQNHDFYHLPTGGYASGKRAWQVRASKRSEEADIAPPVRPLYVRDLIRQVAEKHHEFEQRAKTGRVSGAFLWRDYQHYLGGLMARESGGDTLDSAEEHILGSFTGIVVRRLRDQSGYRSGDVGDSSIGALFADKFRQAGLLEPEE